MARILNVKDQGVTQGVIGRDLTVEQHLVEVTFEDAQGIIHTVTAHKDGPWKTAEEIVEAWGNHTLHPNPTENPPPPDDQVGRTEGWQ